MAQTWQTVLTYQLAPVKGAVGYDLAADALGNVFSGGEAAGSSGYGRGLVLKTDSTEASWSLSDDTNPNPGYYESEVYSLGFDSNGNLYSVGQLWPDGGLLPPYWQVRKSADRGATWTTVDLYQYPSGSWIDVTGFAADSSGNVFVVGGAADAAGNRHWLVRKSADGGQSWALVDDLIGNLAAQAAFVPGAGIFVVGTQGTFGSAGWTVRRSLDDGATWATVDAPFSSHGGAWSVASDSVGNIYVVGSQSVTTTTTKPKQTITYDVWVTRKSTDGGNTWSTVDKFNLVQNVSAVAHAVAMTAAGNVVAVGQADYPTGMHVNSNSTHWIVRSPGSSGTWQTVDDFQLLSGSNASARGVVTDAAGNLLVTGSAAIYPTGLHWVVRKLP